MQDLADADSVEAKLLELVIHEPAQRQKSNLLDRIAAGEGGPSPFRAKQVAQ